METTGLWLCDARSVVDGYVEVLYAEWTGTDGVTAANEANSKYYYARYNTSTHVFDSRQEVDLTGRGMQ